MNESQRPQGKGDPGSREDRMSGNESGRGHDSGEPAAHPDLVAWAAEVIADGENPEDRVGIPLTLDSLAIPSSRLAHLESPAEMYTFMKLVPNNRPWTVADEEWLQSFSRQDEENA
ncbi:hypothetical protein [Streptomyces microflavus]|uniref:hypothetical protein n=1 Tax=Streptomyces microflavus TaxID=1919 RepID=UPI0036463355